MSQQVPEVQLGLPVFEPWHRWLLGGLLAAYVIELLLVSAGLPLYAWLAWYEIGSDVFQPWQPLTRFVVQGNDRAAAFDVLLSLFLMIWFLPMAERSATRPDIAKATVAAAVGGTVLPLAVDLAGFAGGAVLGWTSLVLTLPMLYGLARPDDDVLLIVFPMKARAFVWLALLVAVVFLLAERSLDTFQGLGVWLGVFGWWHLLGPGGRRRQLKRKAEDIRSELRRFEVIEGGRQRPQGRQDGDEWVH